MKILFNKTAKENILQLIMGSSGFVEGSETDFEFPKDALVLGTPAALESAGEVNISTPNQLINESFNTTLKVSVPEDNIDFAGETTLTYRRINLTTQWEVIYGKGAPLEYTLEKLGVESEDEITEEKLKAYLLEQFKVHEDSVTINATYNSDRKSASFTISPIADSLLYTPDNTAGGTEPPLSVTVSKDKASLTEVFGGSESELNGFEYETPSAVEADGMTYPDPATFSA